MPFVCKTRGPILTPGCVQVKLTGSKSSYSGIRLKATWTCQIEPSVVQIKPCVSNSSDWMFFCVNIWILWIYRTGLSRLRADWEHHAVTSLWIQVRFGEFGRNSCDIAICNLWIVWYFDLQHRDQWIYRWIMQQRFVIHQCTIYMTMRMYRGDIYTDTHISIHIYEAPGGSNEPLGVQIEAPYGPNQAPGYANQAL